LLEELSSSRSSHPPSSGSRRGGCPVLTNCARLPGDTLPPHSSRYLLSGGTRTLSAGERRSSPALTLREGTVALPRGGRHTQLGAPPSMSGSRVMPLLLVSAQSSSAWGRRLSSMRGAKTINSLMISTTCGIRPISRQGSGVIIRPHPLPRFRKNARKFLNQRENLTEMACFRTVDLPSKVGHRPTGSPNHGRPSLQAL
jgi:hypothetical protein